MDSGIPSDAPGFFDFDAFSAATRSALELLSPYMDLPRRPSSLAVSIYSQCREYVEAIKLGLSTAQHGFNVTQDILSLAENLDMSTAAERNRYLAGTLKLSEKASSEVSQTLKTFRDIRKTMYELTERYREQKSSTYFGEDRKSSEDLLRGMRRLEEFSFQASLLSRWLDWVILETTPRPVPHFEVDFVDSLRQRPVLQRWRQLNAQFAQYTDVVREIQDAYPSLWETPVRSDSNSSDEISVERMRGNYTYRRESPSRSTELIERMNHHAGCCTIM